MDGVRKKWVSVEGKNLFMTVWERDSEEVKEE